MELVNLDDVIKVISDDKITDETSLAVMHALGDDRYAETLNMACDRHIQMIKELPVTYHHSCECTKCKYFDNEIDEDGHRYCFFFNKPISEPGSCSWGVERK